MNEIKSQIVFLEEITSKIWEISKRHSFKLNGIKIHDPESFISIYYFERLTVNLHAINILLGKLYLSNELENPIGLILRANLNDCRYIFTLYDIKKNEISQYPETLKKIIGENFQRMLKDFNKQRNISQITEQEYNQAIENIKIEYKSILLFSKIDIDKIFNENYRIKICSSKFPVIEDLYLFYSKYEHFGLSTVICQDYINLKLPLERIELGIMYSLEGILAVLQNLNIEEIELLKILIELSERSKKNELFINSQHI